VRGKRGPGFDFIETRSHVCRGFGLGADRVEIRGDVRGSWRGGVEGDVFVAGTFVDGEGDELGGHLVVCQMGAVVGGWEGVTDLVSYVVDVF